MIVEFVESLAKVDALLPTLYEMVTDGMIDVQDTTVVKVANMETAGATVYRGDDL